MREPVEGLRSKDEGAAERTVFFIAGLPRSRTAWLANLLTWGNTFCHHDLWGRAKSVQDFVEIFDMSSVQNQGNADAGNALHHEALTAEFPEAKWFIVNRPIAEVHASCQRVGLANMATLEMLARKIEELRARVNVVCEFNFQDLCAEMVGTVARASLPGWSCSMQRMLQLDALNVQTFAPAALAKIASLKPSDLCPPEPLVLSLANQRYLDQVRQMCGANEQAFVWFLAVLETATVWDHCIDGDGVAPAMADRVFTALTTEWPLNDWWLQHRAALVPALVAARSAWRWSNRPAAPKFKAYDIYTEIPATMAWLIGGNALVERAIPTIRELAFALMHEDEARDGGKK